MLWIVLINLVEINITNFLRERQYRKKKNFIGNKGFWQKIISRIAGYSIFNYFKCDSLSVGVILPLFNSLSVFLLSSLSQIILTLMFPFRNAEG